jgi:hypothetical protein
MRGVCTVIFLLATCAAHGQQPASAPSNPPPEPAAPAPETSLPDSPGQLLQKPQAQNPQTQNPQTQEPQSPTAEDQESIVVAAKAAYAASGTKPPPCRTSSWLGHHPVESVDTVASSAPLQCVNVLDPYARFLDTRMPIPMTPRQKGYLAFRDIVDPFNIITILGSSAITIAIDPDTAYGPGFKGFGKLSGISFSQDAIGEFFGTFLIPSIAHEDPHYHRMPTATFPRRLLHAMSRTVIAQSDYGHPMPNYATLLTYPIASEISNLYVPGIESDGPSTVKRIFIGYALDPVNNIVTEFLPDLAKHIHVRVIFVQQILNQIAVNPTGLP